MNHKDLNNPKNNNEIKKTFKMRLKKNGNDFADVAVNDNGKYYYRKFNNLGNFFEKLNENDNSIFQLAKNNNSIPNKYYSSPYNNSSRSQTRRVPHIKVLKRSMAPYSRHISRRSYPLIKQESRRRRRPPFKKQESRRRRRRRRRPPF